jgi:elongation factor P--(R)-beta-lysine ligase
MNGSAPWQPSASLQTLRLRAQLLRAVRAFFDARGVLEVDTPALVRHAVTDRHIQSARVQLPGHLAPLYLHTSPEYAMKRLLAAGSGDIYQLAHVFRGEEASPLHNAEFMLLEWYRCGYSLPELMAEVAELVGALLAPASPPGIETLRYADAFARYLGLDPLGTADASLRDAAIARGLTARLALAATREELLDWFMAVLIGPRLGQSTLCFLHHYPAAQAALARLDPLDARVALRFELYHRGIELANGFEELAEPVELRARFERDRGARAAAGLAAPQIDEALLAALAAGLPAVSGVALGVDRLLMLRAGVAHIDAVLPFPLARA